MKHKKKDAKEELYLDILRRLDEDEWSVTEHTLRHAASRQELWIANGMFFVDTYPVHTNFSLRQKIQLYRVVKQIIARIVKRRFARIPEPITPDEDNDI